MIINISCPEYNNTNAFVSINVATVIGVIVNSYGIYTIKFHSSAAMKDYAKWLLVFQIWSTLCDITFGELVTPLLIFPVVGGSPVGLLRLMNIDVRIQVIIGWVVMAEMMHAINLLFAVRQQAILPYGHRFKMKDRNFMIMTIGYYAWLSGAAIGIHLIVYQFNDYSDKTSWKDYLRFKCVIDDPFFFAYIYPMAIWVPCFAMMLIFNFTVFNIFCISTSISHIKISFSDVSAKTRKMQRHGIVVLSIQSFLPLTILVIPISIASLNIFTDAYSLSFLNPWITFSVSLHGIFSTLLMVVLHAPYRAVIINRIKWFLTTNATSESKNTLSHIVSLDLQCRTICAAASPVDFSAVLRIDFTPKTAVVSSIRTTEEIPQPIIINAGRALP